MMGSRKHRRDYRGSHGEVFSYYNDVLVFRMVFKNSIDTHSTRTATPSTQNRRCFITPLIAEVP